MNCIVWCKAICANDSHVVSSDYVETKYDLFHPSRWTKDTFVTFVKDQIRGLIIASEVSNQVPPVICDNCYHL